MSSQAFKDRLQPGPGEFTRRLIAQGEIQTALDIGCGKSSYLSRFRPGLKTVGLDAFEGAINCSRERNLHDDYILANILECSPDEILAKAGGQKFDLVALFDVIEHLPKRLGWELLEKCEQLTSRYLLIQTPNGFVEQGPEDGNIYQRHLSGWFTWDFEGLGYRTAGCSGTRFFHGYAGQFKWNFPGVKVADFALGMVLNLEHNSKYAFNIMAWKDVRGVPARLKY